MTRSLGVILLALWLLVTAALTLTNLQIVAVNIVQGVLAARAGVCLLIGK